MTTSAPVTLDVAALRASVQRGYAGSPLLRAKLDAAGIRPADLSAAEDLERLPFTTKEDLRAATLTELSAVPEREIGRASCRERVSCCV